MTLGVTILRADTPIVNEFIVKNEHKKWINHFSCVMQINSDYEQNKEERQKLKAIA